MYFRMPIACYLHTKKVSSTNALLLSNSLARKGSVGVRLALHRMVVALCSVLGNGSYSLFPSLFSGLVVFQHDVR